MSRNRIVVNGMTVEVEGNNVSFRNGAIYVDDVCVESGLSGEVHVYWYGSLAKLDANGPVTCHGNVHGDVRANGPVHCQEVMGSARANGRVGTARVGGDIRANGSVHIT